jgi:putative ABC transport system permease protein
MGAAILQAAPALIPADLLPAGVALTFDGRVIGFCTVAALVVGCVFGFAPAWQASRFSAAQSMAADGRTMTGRGGRMRSLLVVAEISTAVILLFAAGLLLRTLLNLEHVDRGYRADSVLSMIIDPLGSRYPTPAANLQFYKAVEAEVASTPGVRSVGWASTLPMGPSYEGTTFFDVVGSPIVRDSQRPTADYQIVSPGYFPTVDLPVVDGRAFSEHDRADTVPVCIVNEAFVRTQLQGRSPIGARVAIRASAAPDAPSTVREVVGVAKQVKGSPDEREALLQIYVPLAQDTVGDMFMVVTPVQGSAAALAPSVRAAIGRVDTEQLVSVRDVMTLEDVARDATSRYRFRAVLVAAFAGLALLLAMIGVFGILAYTVQQRLREFGVRRALGATGGDVWRLVAGSAFRLVGVGVAIGLLVSAVASGVLATMLFGVEPLDPLTFGSVLVLLAMTAAVSVAAPAWRATRVDPVVALRND